MHLIVRTSWVYAARGTNFLNTIIRLASEREELRVVADQIGAPTSARAIAEALAEVVRAMGPDIGEGLSQRGGILNVACSGETSWHGFAAAIVEGARARGMALKCERIVPIRTEEFPTRTKRPANSRLSTRRIAEVFSIAPPSWRDALARELADLP
jgi:dTDP-4-dehydrorhamnose reductase